MEVPVFVHIGSAKCASTSLQKHYFAKHDELFHLGCSGGGLVPPYLNVGVKTAIEWDLRLACDFVYDHERVSGVFDECRSAFRESGKRWMSLSSESFTISMHHECDITQTADRLFRLLGKGTKVLFVTRRQDDHLKSIYKEWVWAGMPLTWREFLKAIFYGQFQSLYSQLFFERVACYYADLFGRENLLVLPVELFFEDQAGFLSRISEFLGIKDSIHELPNANMARPEWMVEQMRQLNEVNQHNLGRTVMEPANTFRHEEFYTEVLGIAPPSGNDEDVRRKRRNVKITRKANGNGSNHSMKLDWSADPYIVEPMERKYSEQNIALKEFVDVDLDKWGYDTISIQHRGSREKGWKKWIGNG